MHYGFGCAFLVSAAATLGALVAALEASVAAIQSPHDAEPVSVNRTFKGDRSPALPGASRIVPEPTLTEPELPEGCVPAAEWRNHIYSTEIPGRCVA